MTLLRFADWSLRVKVAVLLVLASLLPLGIAAFDNIRDSRGQLLATTENLLAARGEQLVGELDTFNQGFQRSVEQLARLPGVVEFCRAPAAKGEKLEQDAHVILGVWANSDPKIRGVALLDRSGVVTLGTEPALVGMNLSFRSFVREALQGETVVSDVFLAAKEVNYAPTIAYLVPVRGTDRSLLGIVALWVRAAALWDTAKASNALAGPGSFAVLFDREGIRIAHTYNDDIVFHPGGVIDPDTLEALVAERRFGERTRELLEDVRSFPEQFKRSRSSAPDRAMFRGFAPVNSKWNYGVGRRLTTVHWTLFYMIPEEVINVQIAAMTREEILFASTITLLALLVSALFTGIILKPIRALSVATERIAAGDLTARIPIGTRRDELGRLSESFNFMVSQIANQAEALTQAKDQAITASRELETFSYSVAHDLRAPLRGMSGFAQVLVTSYHEKLDAEGQDWLREIQLNANKMAELIDALLSLARVSRSELKSERIDVSALVREATAVLASSEPDRPVKIEVQAQLYADADSRLVRVLFENLLRNAWKFTSKEPAAHIEFGAIQKDGGIAFFVRDNGAGFDMAFANKLFVPFHRLHTVDEFPGTGIGLATVQRIVQRHGGRIWAEGVVDGGATFYFTFGAPR